MKQLNWYQIFGNTHTIPDGKTVTPTDDIQTLLHCANIWDKSYTTIGEMIADDDTLFLTLIDNNAIDYLVRSTTFASSIVASESAMQYIGASDYASETLLSDSTWLTAIDGSAYKDYVLNASNPNMTGMTTPSGEVGGNYSSTGTYAAWKSFDGNNSTYGYKEGSSDFGFGLLEYTFPIPIVVKKAEISYGYHVGSMATVHTEINSIQSYDNGEWSDIETFPYSNVSVGTPSTTTLYMEDSTSKTDKYRLKLPTRYTSAYNLYIPDDITSVHLYGRINAGVQSWLAAGGIKNKKYTTVSEVLSDLTTLAALMASSDAIDYLVTAKGWATEICSDSNAMADIGMNNYAANTLLADETWCNAICNSTYMESVLNVKVPTMTSNTTPYGEAFGSTAGTYYPWKAFNGTNSSATDMWYAGVPATIGYKFTRTVKVVRADITGRNTDAAHMYSVRNFVVQGSNDDFVSDVNDLGSFVNTDNSPRSFHSYIFTNNNEYQSYRLSVSTCNKPSSGDYDTCAIGMLQFYGRKDI